MYIQKYISDKKKYRAYLILCFGYIITWDSCSQIDLVQIIQGVQVTSAITVLKLNAQFEVIII